MSDYDLPTTDDVERFGRTAGLLTIVKALVLLVWRGAFIARQPGGFSLHTGGIMVTVHKRDVYLRLFDGGLTKTTFCSSPNGCNQWTTTRGKDEVFEAFPSDERRS